MTRVLSALVLLPLVIGIVWYLPPIGTLILALVAAVLAFVEYAGLARALGVEIPRAITGAAVVLTCPAFAAASYVSAPGIDGRPSATMAPLEVVLIAGMIVVSSVVLARRGPGPSVLAEVAIALFPVFYIGIPLGAIAAIRVAWNGGGALALLLLVLTIVVSDSAQYYTGRALGRRPLAPAVSPKKTREGAVGGVVFGTLAFVLGGRWILTGVPTWRLVVAGVVIVILGIIGDLFESLLKRSAGVKDSSHLIPGHGGILDRIDSWLFAGPAFYLFIRYFSLP